MTEEVCSPETITAIQPSHSVNPEKKALRGHGSGLARHSIRYRKPDGGVWREPFGSWGKHIKMLRDVAHPNG
ncbi:hypothetical protein AGR4A_Cc50139 [Agrobacterium tumefaciens str. B6]|uniref:Uncharacterized protein n=2 Tax=Agrobacterium tumefaciens TaxID=358 RepID=A0A822V4M4_AGRTU|nr:hypothetical protein AGR4C_Cc50344 [Agrobacterium tumefaciens str. Kerr 14]CVI19102.1 hypothetical protein AGR4A_Cc50139 [Agrobacterium tumefaciens str. B6]